MNHVAFPGLGLDFTINREAFSLFGKSIYWYAIIIAVGFLVAAVYVVKRSKQFGIQEDNLLDALICAVPTAIVFARLYYVIFNFDIYRNDPIRILYIWEGGIAIYGGIIGAIIAVAIYCKVKHVKLSAMLDLGALGLLIGQCIGRWGNFVNGEAYGIKTDLPWRMEIFDVDAMARIAVHPAFLYESLWNLLGFVLLHFRSKHRKFSGEIFLLYIAWYGLGRGFIEGLRTDSLYFMNTGLRVSQFLGFASCLVAIVVLFYFYLFRDPELLELSLQIQADAVEEKEAAGQSAQADTMSEEAPAEEMASESTDDTVQMEHTEETEETEHGGDNH